MKLKFWKFYMIKTRYSYREVLLQCVLIVLKPGQKIQKFIIPNIHSKIVTTATVQVNTISYVDTVNLAVV